MPRESDRPWDSDEDDRPRRRRRDEEDYDDEPPRRRRRDEDDYDDDDRPRRASRRQQAPTNGLATASIILGGLSLLTLCLTGIPAIICGVLALGKPVGRGLAVAGIVLGLIGTVGGGVAGYFGYRAAESAKARIKDTNNMKQIGMAMHAQSDSHGHFIGPYATPGRFGKPPAQLSWRVGILPYIEQNNLYKEFDLDSAWDSPRNKKLSDTPIATYTTPLDELDGASTKTPYRVFVSDAKKVANGRALFTDDGLPPRLVAVADGTSNTIMMAHATEQVPWAEPRELKYDPDGPLPKLGHPRVSGGFMVLMADGSVRIIQKDIPERTLRALITRDGGEVVDNNW